MAFINNVLTAYHNTTATHLSSQELAHLVNSASFLDSTLSFSRTSFMIIDFMAMTYPYASSNSYEVSGMKAEELMSGGPAWALTRIYPADCASYESLVIEALAFYASQTQEEKEKHLFSMSFRFVHPDGHLIQLYQNSITLKWGENGRPLIGLLTLTDITNYKSDERVLFLITRVDENATRSVVRHKWFPSNEEYSLTTRELEVVSLLTDGHSSSEIAETLSITDETVKHHKKSIMHKLGCINSAHIVSVASLCGLCAGKVIP